MKLSLYRIRGSEESTIGLLYIDSFFSCFTLEDQFREIKVKGETRIPAGTYRMTLKKEGGKHEQYKLKYPDIHKGMLWIMDVPNFNYILIHIGNNDSDSDGCILIGDSVKQNITDNGMLAESTICYKRVYPIVANELEKGNIVTIEIFDSIPININHII